MLFSSIVGQEKKKSPRKGMEHWAGQSPPGGSRHHKEPAPPEEEEERARALAASYRSSNCCPLEKHRFRTRFVTIIAPTAVDATSINMTTI